MKKRITMILLTAVAMLLSMAGCGGSHNDNKDPADPNTGDAVIDLRKELTVGLANDLKSSLDPHKSTDAGTREVMFNVFEGLMKPTPEGDLAPALAERYTVSEDGTVYSFTLREDVKYHNGDLVTADDVLWSFERCAHPTDPEIKPYPALQNVLTAEVQDEKTVVFTLAQPDVDFLCNMTLAVLPMEYTEQDTAPIGTGPYRFVSREAQNNVILERFDGYWGEKAYLEKVTLKIMENADSMVLALQSGAIDLCNHLPTEQAVQLSGNFDIVEGSMSLVQALYLNNAVEPLNNELVRKALCYATDRRQIIDIAFDGYGTQVGSSMYPGLVKYFDDSLTNLYPYDPEKAVSLLEEAGYPDGFRLEITVPSNYPQHVSTAMVLAEQYKAVGIDVVIREVEWNTWYEDVYKGRKYEATVTGVDASTMTARAMLYRFESDSAKNFINYVSDEFDTLYRSALSAATDGEQVALYKDAQRNLAEHAANVYIQAPADLVAVRRGLTGVRFYPMYILDLAGLRWE